MTAIASPGYNKSIQYNSQGLLSYEAVNISGAPTYATYYGYDSYLRPSTVTYPDNEVVTTYYNSMGLPAKLHSSLWGDIVDGNVNVSAVSDAVNYDEAGRLRDMRMPYGTDLWRRHGYYGWTTSSSPYYGGGNGRLYYIFVGTSQGTADKLNLNYSYDSFSNITRHYDNSGYYSFGYDGQNRLTSGFGKNFTYDTIGRFTQFESGYRGTSNSFPLHGYKDGNFTYDANGNMTKRGIIKTNGQWVNQAQTLTWNHENRLSNVTGTGINGTSINESYLYDADGQRVKKTSNGTNTYYPFAHYHLENGYKVKYYFFNGMPVARYQENGNNFLYMHTDHLGSVALTTYSSSGAVRDIQKYCAYGKQRSGTTCTSGNDLDTSKHFTGQDYDSTGLHYYRARYYDDHLGQFISPDTLVPDASLVIDYNRYAYTRGNPLKYTDPSGHCVNSSTTSQPVEISYDNNECWRLANTIGAMWDSTDYWSNRFTSSEVFFNNVANNGHNGTDFFQGQLDSFFSSEEGKAWLGTQPDIPQKVRDDPQCGGAKACQGLLNHAAQVERKCQQIDCVAVGNDLVGVAGTVTVLVACIPGAAVCATSTAAFIGGAAATGSTIYGTSSTIMAWKKGTATDQDLTVSLLTAGGSLLSGGMSPDMYDVQVGYSVIQLVWDMIPKSEE